MMDRPLPPKQIVRAQVRRILTQTGWQACTGQVAVTIEKLHPNLQIGQNLRVIAGISRPLPPMNPGQFDMAEYCRRQRILSTLHISHLDGISILPADQSSASASTADALRTRARQLLAAGFSSSQSMNHSVMLALTLGDRELEMRSVQDDFSNSGTAHLLAVSGLHVMVVAAFAFVGLFGCFVVNPNEGRVLQLFGRYVGTVRTPGLRWANPFLTKRTISLRVRSFETERLKVNDLDGIPIEMGAVVVWRVVDTAEALFQVQDYEKYVHAQSEAALRNLATRYPYDIHDEEKLSLRGHTATIAAHLKTEIQERLEAAGVEIVESRITHLAYAPEIAHAMLQRQQAGAMIAARTRIVEGAVGMVEHALKLLSAQHIVDLDEERKAAMVSNLLVVLCSERSTQPVINTGTLY